VANEVAADRKSIEALTGLRPVQLQRIAEPIIVRKPDTVVWPASRSVVEALLGQVHAIVCRPGPLWWDAAAANIPVFCPEPLTAVESEVAARRLAHVVPSRLVECEEFWQSVVSDVLNGRAGRA